MSDTHRPKHPLIEGNPLGSRVRSRVARSVHDDRLRAVRPLPVSGVTVGLLALLGGCVIPPSLSVDNQDAGVNSPPAILSVRTDQEELAEPGPLAYPRGPGMLSLTLLDTDVDDRLFVRLFVDYTITDPTAPRSTCTAAATGTPTRTTTCDLGALCQTADVGQTRLLNIAVFDREVLEAGTPQFRAMDTGGQTTSRTYELQCTNP